MSEPWIAPLLALFGVIFTAFGTYSVAKIADKSKRREEDAKTREAEADRLRERDKALWETLEEQVTRLERRVQDQDDSIRALRDEHRANQKQITELESKNRTVMDQLRYRDELVADFLESHSAWVAWADGGATPPPPSPSWRVSQAMLEYEKSKEVG